MALATTYPENILIGDDAVVWGTAALGTSYGQVKAASFDRDASQQEIMGNQGGLRALVMANPAQKLSFTTVFDSGVTAPGLGDEIAFPLVGVTGRVLNAKVNWTEAGSRELALEVAYWDSIDNGSDAMEAYSGDTSSWVPMNITFGSNIAEITTQTAHGFTVGERVFISGIDTVAGVVVDGWRTVLGVTSTTVFSCAEESGTTDSSLLGTGTITRPWKTL